MPEADVGVVGAETGCPEQDEGRTLTRSKHNIQTTHKDMDKKVENRTNKQSAPW